MSSLIERVQTRVAQMSEPPDPTQLAAVIRSEAGVISDVDLLETLRTLREDSVGIGVLEKLLSIPGVTDVVVNSPDSVWFDRGDGLERSDVGFASDADVRRLATRLAVSCGRRLDDAQPYADGAMIRDDGLHLRVHCLLSPPALAHPMISIRVLRQRHVSLENLAQVGAFPEEILDYLQSMLAQRHSFLVTGGTGSGKTTLLSALIAGMPQRERIICIEDTPELLPDHPHVLNLIVRGSNVEGSGAITSSDLLRQALRMRPDRLVVGEIRGAEVVDLLAALNTGHDGGGGTVHANSTTEIPARMEALAMLGGMSRDALHAQLSAAVKVVLAMRRRPQDGRRHLYRIGVLCSDPLRVETVWEDSSCS